MRVRPNYFLEQQFWSRGVAAVAGVDEAGVGALAGPVVAAAVILAPGVTIDGLADSKLLVPKRREMLFAVIRECAVAIATGQVEVEEVDRLNVYWAAMEARRRAVAALPIVPGHVLVDGKRRITGCRLAQTPVIDGDSLSASIAAASIVAKVTRDWLMREYAQLYPGYGFELHKGYGTRVHLDALGRFGPSPLHRRSFGPVSIWERAQLDLGFGAACSKSVCLAAHIVHSDSRWRFTRARCAINK
jgi:ribonuclease HII